MKRAAGVATFVILCACGRSSSEGAGASASSSNSQPAPNPSGAASAPAATTAKASDAPQNWQGAYKTAAGTLNVPPDWAKVHWSSSDTTAGVGDGTIQLVVDPKTRVVSGTLDGVVGPAVVEGTLHDNQVSASVTRKDPADRGFSGTLIADATTDRITGTLSLASADGARIRTGTFTLSPSTH